MNKSNSARVIAGFRPIASPSGAVLGYEVVAVSADRSLDARAIDLALIAASIRAARSSGTKPMLLLSVSPSTVHSAGGRFVQSLAELKSLTSAIGVTVGKNGGVFDAHRLLQFAALCRQGGLLVGVCGKSFGWVAAASLARAVVADYVAIPSRRVEAAVDDEVDASFVQQHLKELFGPEALLWATDVRTRSGKTCASLVGVRWLDGSEIGTVLRALPSASTRGFTSNRTVLLMATTVLLAACASAPIPAVPDGSSRVPVNDPGRIERLQAATVQQTAAVTERSQLMQEVEVLRKQVVGLTTAVRVLLASELEAPTPVAMVARPQPASPVETTSEGKARGVSTLVGAAVQGRAVETTPDGIVFRVFHPTGDTSFRPEGAFAKALLVAAKNGQTIEIHGRTDSATPTEANVVIARARAVEARRWLVSQGVDASRVRARYSSAGRFLSDGKTEEAKALNRRVEVRIRGDVAQAVAILNQQG